MRICAVSFPDLRIELAREGMEPSRRHLPLVVVVAPPPMTETKLLGNTRISVVSREARALGVQPGNTLAQARARAGELTVRVVRPDAVRDVLARLAEVGLAFGATVSFGVDEGISLRASLAPWGDVVWIDVTGCAHLHAPRASTSIFDGETLLASRLANVFASLGHTCAVALADGPRVAAMLARARADAIARMSADRRRRPSHSLPDIEPLVVPSGDNARALASLPVTALPLPSEDVRWLAKIGVRTIEELRALPRAGLGTRLGAHARDVLSLIDGEDRAPLSPYVPPRIPEEEVDLEYGVDGAQALTFVAKTLTDRLAVRLQGRAVATTRLELELRLDAAMLEGATASDATERAASAENIALVALDLPTPLSTASDLLAVLRPKIERLTLSAPVLGAKLRAAVLVRERTAPLSLFDPQPKAERALPRLVAELVSELGPCAVSSLVLGNSWVPEDRSQIVPFRDGMRGTDTASDAKPLRRLLSSVPEPTRLLPEPRPIARQDVRVLRHLSRVSSVEWWKEKPDVGAVCASRRAIDYVQAWLDEGAAWIEVDRATGAMRVRGWFD